MVDLGSINDKRREKGYPIILDSQLIDILRYVPESEYEDTLLNHVLADNAADAIAEASEPSVEDLVEDPQIDAIEDLASELHETPVPRPRKKKKAEA